MSTIYTPYTYLIGWSKIDQWYYGVRYATKTNCLYESGCHPDELWHTYFTSSKKVNEYRTLYGEPDIIQIRKTFETKKLAIKWEETVLRRLDIKNNKKMMNSNVAGAIYKNLDNAKGKPSKLRGKKLSEEHKEKLRKPKKGVSKLKGRKLSEEHKEKLRQAKVYYVPWNAGKKGVQDYSDETRKKMSELAKLRWKNTIRKPKPIIQCFYCGDDTTNKKFCSNSCKAKYNYENKISSLMHMRD